MDSTVYRCLQVTECPGISFSITIYIHNYTLKADCPSPRISYITPNWKSFTNVSDMLCGISSVGMGVGELVCVFSYKTPNTTDHGHRFQIQNYVPVCRIMTSGMKKGQLFSFLQGFLKLSDFFPFHFKNLCFLGCLLYKKKCPM